jgi:hypothetical protein
LDYDELPVYFDEENEETQRISRCHHEAAHAVFAYHAGLKIDSVVAEEEGGRCDINLSEHREWTSPGQLACFCLAGAYAAYLATTLQHPDSKDCPLEWLREEAEKTLRVMLIGRSSIWSAWPHVGSHRTISRTSTPLLGKP